LTLSKGSTPLLEPFAERERPPVPGVDA